MKKFIILISFIVIVLFCLGGVAVVIINQNNSSKSEDNQELNLVDPNYEDNAQAKTDTHSDVTKLIFIHHSTGENWLMDSDGGLGKALMTNNYFVSDTNYGWGPDSVGDTTDIGNWWRWFRSENSDTYLEALYNESEQNSEYSRLPNNPGGENEIIMFKSCFPNSNLLGNVDDSIPGINNNPLKGEDAYSEHHTIPNAKGIYIDLLEYFITRQDRVFIVITAPPLGQGGTDVQSAANARAFNNWLKNDWLDNYNHNNVAVFDLYNVLTNYGDSNYSEYQTDEWDDHPSTKGNQMATGDFIPFLNAAYNRWK